ncbi:MAG: penicillin-binding protein 2 [Ruminococcaceae bacterium]|nr:penicillin-binding protein 2 [Oscillospiraceae bacterium]
MIKKASLEQRGALCMMVLFILIFVSLLRICAIATDKKYSETAAGQTSYKLTVKHQRGTIYDTNMVPITNTETEIIGALTPANGAISEVRDYLYDEQVGSLAHRLSEGKPVLVRLKEEINGQFVKSITVRTSAGAEQLAPHLIGYVNGTGHGVSGVEAAFDSVLYSDKSVGFLYSRSALGDILEEYNVIVENYALAETDGVKLTIDSKIQQAVERATADMKAGAVIVSEVGSGKIRALASYPTYDISNISDYLNDPAAPLINRAFCAYNVGSVFKLCVAAAALEDESFGETIHRCTGSIEIAGKTFACHKASGHGAVDMNDAIMGSCNTYFYTLAMQIGAEKIYNMASSLGFGNRYFFADNLYTEQGFLPTVEDIGISQQSLANLAIGQGSLMLTPISLLPLYEAIANGGVYHKPTLVEGVIEDGVLSEAEETYPTRVMSKNTAELLKSSLCDVINEGTGTSAKPSRCSAAGKTATAQTGWIKDGRAVDHSWLCGFFPAENPRYVVVIISEDTSGEGTPCGPLFSAVCDAVFALN